MSSTQSQHYDDEISLVDLAATFIKRRRVFYAVFLVCILAGFAYAFVTEDTYQYTSLLQIAEKNSDEFLEPPAITIATLENRWFPEKEAVYRKKTSENLPFTVQFVNPENTGLVRLVSEGVAGHSDIVKNVHQHLIEQIQARHNALLTREKQKLEIRKASVEETVTVLQAGENSGPALVDAYGRKAEIEEQLDSLSETEVIVLARQGNETTNLSTFEILVFFTIFGLLGGVVLAFIAEFVGTVRDQLTES